MRNLLFEISTQHVEGTAGPDAEQTQNAIALIIEIAFKKTLKGDSSQSENKRITTMVQHHSHWYRPAQSTCLLTIHVVKQLLQELTDSKSHEMCTRNRLAKHKVIVYCYDVYQNN